MVRHVAPAGRPRSVRGRLFAGVAGLLAVLGVVLIVVAACSSRPGPPQPSAASAGTIDPETSSAQSILSSSAVSAAPASSPSAASSPSVASSPSSVSAPVGPSSPTTSAAPTTSKATSSSKPAPKTTPKPTANPTPAAPKPLLLAASHPTKISIPSIGVTSDLLDFGLNPDNTVQVQPLSEPDSKAGWFDKSPSPGTIGPSIILGHIDSKQYGPGVFYNLGKMKPGDQVSVTRADGVTAVFKVDAVRSYPKNDFPTVEVYQNLDHSGLRLITCGGTFNVTEGSYENNIVVFASLVSSHR